MSDCMPKEQYEYITAIQHDMLEITNMTEDEAWNFAFRCWQCGYVKKQPFVDRIMEQLEVLQDLVNLNQKLVVSQAIDIVKRGGVE